MRDIVKTNVKRQQSSKRQHRRTRYRAMYFLLVIFLVLGIGISLSMTMLFNLTTIEVDNETQYGEQDIITASGIRAGDNLVRLDTAVAEQRIKTALPYAEQVTVKRKFPTTVQIHVTKAEPIANVKYSHGYLLISVSNRNLETRTEPMPDLLLIEGFDPASDTPGQEFLSSEPGENDVLRAVTAAVVESGVEGIVSVDITDHYGILVRFGDKIVFEMGNCNDAAYKLQFAAETIKKLNPDRNYRLRMIGSNQISVISEDSAVITTQSPDENTTELTETTTTLSENS